VRVERFQGPAIAKIVHSSGTQPALPTASFDLEALAFKRGLQGAESILTARIVRIGFAVSIEEAEVFLVALLTRMIALVIASSSFR